MARRQTPVLRNLDDPLRVLNLLSLRSCSLVLCSYAFASGLDLAFGLVTRLFGGLAFLAELGLSAVVACALALAERSDDEHLVPSMARYYVGGASRVLWSGMGWEPKAGKSRGRA